MAELEYFSCFVFFFWHHFSSFSPVDQLKLKKSIELAGGFEQVAGSSLKFHRAKSVLTPA